MYSEISACPCHPLVRITSHPLLRYNYATPHLNHPRGYFCGPAASALLSTLFLIVTLAATTLLFSNALTRIHTHTNVYTHTYFGLTSFSRFRHSFPRASDEPRRARKRNRVRGGGGGAVWLDCKLDLHYFRFSPAFSLPLFPSLARERESTRSIYVPISRTGAF